MLSGRRATRSLHRRSHSPRSANRRGDEGAAAVAGPCTLRMCSLASRRTLPFPPAPLTPSGFARALSSQHACTARHRPLACRGARRNLSRVTVANERRRVQGTVDNRSRAPSYLAKLCSTGSSRLCGPLSIARGRGRSKRTKEEGRRCERDWQRQLRRPPPRAFLCGRGRRRGPAPTSRHKYDTARKSWRAPLRSLDSELQLGSPLPDPTGSRNASHTQASSSSPTYSRSPLLTGKQLSFTRSCGELRFCASRGSTCGRPSSARARRPSQVQLPHRLSRARHAPRCVLLSRSVLREHTPRGQQEADRGGLGRPPTHSPRGGGQGARGRTDGSPTSSRPGPEVAGPGRLARSCGHRQSSRGVRTRTVKLTCPRRPLVLLLVDEQQRAKLDRETRVEP